MQKYLGHIVFMFILCFLISSTYAEQDDSIAGSADGEKAAKKLTGKSWCCIGCIGGPVGLIIATEYYPKPPSAMLTGKSPEYISAFDYAYKETANKIQIKRTAIGCAIFVALVLFIATYDWAPFD